MSSPIRLGFAAMLPAMLAFASPAIAQDKPADMPFCSATVTDHCMQKEGMGHQSHGMRAHHHGHHKMAHKTARHHRKHRHVTHATGHSAAHSGTKAPAMAPKKM